MILTSYRVYNLSRRLILASIAASIAVSTARGLYVVGLGGLRTSAERLSSPRLRTFTTGLVSPAGVKAHVDRRLANPAEAQVGVDNTKLMTPLRAKEAIYAQVPSFIFLCQY